MKNIIIGVLFIALLLVFFIGQVDWEGDKKSSLYSISRKIEKKPEWESKIDLKKEKPLKVSLITDTHLTSSRGSSRSIESRYLKESYLNVFDDFNASVQEFDPEFIIHLGDIIEGTGESVELGKKNISLARKEMERAGKPIFWVIGNHDLRAVPRRHFQEALDIDYSNKFFDHGPYRFIILDAGYRETGAPVNPLAGDYVPGFVPEESLLWFEEKLKTDKHVVVLMHYSIISRSETRKGPVKNKNQVVDLLEKYNAMAVFQGHIEKRYFGEKNGVKYYAFPGTKKEVAFPKAHYDLVFEGGDLEVTMHYRDPKTNEKVTESFLKEGSMAPTEKEYQLIKEQKQEVVEEEEWESSDKDDCELEAEC